MGGKAINKENISFENVGRWEETGFYRDIYILKKQQSQKFIQIFFMYNCATYAILDILSSNFKSNPYIKYVQNCKFGHRHKILYPERQYYIILRFLI